MSGLALSLRNAPARERRRRSPSVEGEGVALAVVAPAFDDDVLVAQVLVAYRLPIEIVNAYDDVARAITLVLEDPSGHRAATLSFAPPSDVLTLDSTPPFRGVRPVPDRLSVTGYISGDVAALVSRDPRSLFFRAVFREYVSSVVELTRDRTIIHTRGTPDVVVDGDDR